MASPTPSCPVFVFHQYLAADCHESYHVTAPNAVGRFFLRYIHLWAPATAEHVRHEYNLWCQASDALYIRSCRYTFIHTDQYSTVNSDYIDDDFLGDLEVFFNTRVVVDYDDVLTRAEATIDDAVTRAEADPDLSHVVAEHIIDRRRYPYATRREVLALERAAAATAADFVQCQRVEPDPEAPGHYWTFVYWRRHVVALPPSEAAAARFTDATWRAYCEDYRHSLHWDDAACTLQRAWRLRYCRRRLAAALSGLRPLPVELCGVILAAADVLRK